MLCSEGQSASDCRADTAGGLLPGRAHTNSTLMGRAQRHHSGSTKRSSQARLLQTSADGEPSTETFVGDPHVQRCRGSRQLYKICTAELGES